MEVFTDMDNNAATATKEELWAERIKDFQGSGLSRKEWCQMHEVALSTFSYWNRKLQSGDTETYGDPVFARLPSEQEIYSGTLSGHAPVTVFLSESIRIEIGPCCPQALMASLLHALKGYA